MKYQCDKHGCNEMLCGCSTDLLDDEEYNGFPNRETWAVNLWAKNNERFYRSITQNLFKLIDQKDTDMVILIAETINRYFDELDFSEANNEQVLRDIGSLWRVDWYRIAEGFIDE